MLAGAFRVFEALWTPYGYKCQRAQSQTSTKMHLSVSAVKHAV